MAAITVPGVTLNGSTDLGADADVVDFDPFCFVCGRCTDHVGEHEELVLVGLAEYRDGGIVEVPWGVTSEDIRDAGAAFNFVAWACGLGYVAALAAAEGVTCRTCDSLPDCYVFVADARPGDFHSEPSCNTCADAARVVH